jgi:hypothetical protein
MRAKTNDRGGREWRRAPALVLMLAAVGMLVSLTLAGSSAALPQYRGVNAHPLHDDHSGSDVERELDLARGAGANVVRVDVSWGSLEFQRAGRLESNYVARLDRLMAAAASRGIKVLAVLVGTPCWASTAPGELKKDCEGAWWDRGVAAYPPEDPADYARVARWLTARYGTRLAALEVWNEPNNPNDATWRAGNDAAAYAALVKAAYPAAKAGNRAVPVLAGSLSRSDRPFLDALYAHGIRGHYDGISIQPYTWGDPRNPAAAPTLDRQFVPGLRWIRRGQIARGDRAPLWLTEFGWTTAHLPSRITEQQQAAYISHSFDLLAPLPYVRAAVLYTLRDDGSDPRSGLDNFGIVTRDFKPKPGYWALRAKLLGSARR